MPSRAEVRVRLEQVLRGIVIAALVVMLWQSLRDTTDSGVRSVKARGIGSSALGTWSSATKAPAGIQLQLDSVPPPVERGWLGALAGAGSSVSWRGSLPAVMIDAQPVASPAGGTRVMVAAPSGSSAVISDDVGVMDTVVAKQAGVSLVHNSVAGQFTARVKGSMASTVQPDSVALHKILVIGNAGWESKFAVAALEEEGWKVDAFILVAPSVDVTQGAGATIDTSHYSAVVALDGAASPYANRIVEFVRTGGGVVLGPAAASIDAFASLRVGAVGRRSSEGAASQPGGQVSLPALALSPIASLRNDAIALERRGGAVTTAAMRIGAGRSLQVGYDDTWRWRMDGGDGGVRDHRAWWNQLVSSVAHAPRVQRDVKNPPTDEAPMIGLVDAVGPGSAREMLSNLPRATSDWNVWLFVLLALGLIGETASRRLRGAA